MKVKKLVLILLFSLFCFATFADDSYKLSVISADDMSVSEKLVELEGKVEISFSTVNNSDNKVRKLSADKILIDVENKCLDALGNVSLTEDSDSSFQGESLSLNWDTLDIVVFGGTSSSDRKNASGSNVTFYTVGDRISYSGSNDAVFFEDGVIGTRANDPYWSVVAKKIGLAKSDIFFSNAVLKLGRVPILWLPVFFYPGNRLSFNPAIGFSSTKGKFLNTTYELYGSFPIMGEKKASADKSDSGDASVLANNFLSLLSSEDENEQIRSGWTYISLEDAGELTGIQKWAYDTGSYFAVFADAWEEYGLSIGYNTKNYLLNKQITLDSVGVLGVKGSDARYSFELNGSYKHDNISFTLKLPALSDPDVKSDYLNRNTVFGLDSVFNAEQTFPDTYSTNQTTYAVVLDGSASYKIKNNISLNLSSLKTTVNYKWNSEEEKYEIDDATFPYISVKSSGKIVDIHGEANKKVETVKLGNRTAQKFFDELSSYPESTGSDETTFSSPISFIKGSTVKNTKEVDSGSGSFKVDYDYSQVFNSSYKEKLEHNSYFNKIDAKLNANGSIPGNWFSFTYSINPVFNSTITEEKPKDSSFKLKSSTSLSVSKLGLSYKLTNYVYVNEQNASKDIDRWGKWDDKDVTEHYLSISKKISSLSLSLKYVLPPIEQVITPSISYSINGFSISSDMSLGKKDDSQFKPTTAHASASLKTDLSNTSISGTYNFEKTEKWDGFTAKENFSLNLLDSQLKLSQSLSLEKCFSFKELSFSADYYSNYIKLNFKDASLDPDKLKIFLKYDVPALYVWKNRIGFEGSFDAGFTYDFVNKYSSSFYADAKFGFAVSKFLDLSLSVKSVNNSFYRYYEKQDDMEVFSMGLLWKDLMKSFDFFGDGRKSTGFNINSFSLSAVHYMEDWTLSLTSTSKIKTVDGKKKLVPDFSFLIKWNAIPELKSTNNWDETDGWEK